VKHIQKDKIGNMVQLLEILRASNANAARVPKFFADGIREVIGKAG